MATADYFSETDLKAVGGGNDGWVNEDMMAKIWDISRIPLPYTDAIGSSATSQSTTYWNEDDLGDPDIANAKVDGQDLTDNDASAGTRLGTQHQISTKTLAVTERAQSSDTVGGNQLSYQLTKQQRKLMRDIEAICLTNQASVQDDGDAVAGQTAGLGAMLALGDVGTSTGGGYSAGGIWAARVPGAKRAITEDMIRDGAADVWEEGGNPRILMSVPDVIRRVSEYMFTSSARIATLTAETNQKGPADAMGSVNVFLTDYGVELTFSPNRMQQLHADSTGVELDAANAYIIDPDYADQGVLAGARTTPLAKQGLADRRAIRKDWCHRVLNTKAHAILADIDPAAPMTASAA